MRRVSYPPEGSSLAERKGGRREAEERKRVVRDEETAMETMGGKEGSGGGVVEKGKKCRILVKNEGEGAEKDDREGRYTRGQTGEGRDPIGAL